MKKIITNKLGKNLCIIVLAILAFMATLIGLNKIETINALGEIKYEDKIYNPIDDNIDYDDNKVLVVLDKNISKVNKIHSDELFGNFPKKEVIDLTSSEIPEYINHPNNNFRQIYEIILPENSKEKVKEAIRELEGIKGILSAEPSYNYEASTVKSANDSYYSSNSQWALNGAKGINAPLAWSITTGSRNIRVGIIDTGISNHSDLDANVVEGWDFRNNDSITNDDEYGHGTCVAGIIGAVGNNSIGVAGINWNVTMVPLQVAIPNQGNTGNIDGDAAVKAIEYATQTYNTNERIHVLNYSVSRFGSNTAILSAIENYPGIFVWSAGNNGNVIDSAPAFNLDNLISVGAIDSNGNRSIWNSEESSVYGNAVNIYAPGSNVKTTAINNSYSSFAGTSAAAPHVAGAAALLLSYNPNLSAAQVKNILINKADSITIENRSAKRLDLGSVLWSQKYSNRIELQNEGYYSINGGCNGSRAGWRIKVINNSSTSMRVIYNMYMCFEDDAKDWTGLGDINYFQLASGASRTVEIDTNAFATTVAFSYVVGSTRYVTYANELDDSWNMINPNLSIKSYQNNGNINLVGKDGQTWIIDVKNNFSQSRRLEYNTKMCFEGDAKGWSGLSDINSSITLSSGGSTTIRISENGFAGTIAVSLVNVSENWRDIYYAYDLNKNCTMSVYTNSMSATQSDSSCVAAGTLVTLADGSKKSVETLTGDEMLLIWNMFSGTFDAAPILFIDCDPVQEYEIINLYFSDGTSVKVISEHAFWDITLNKYVYLDNNAADYIGHWFSKQETKNNGEVAKKKTKLVDVIIENEITSAYSPVTYGHLCYYVNGMLSIPGGTSGLTNILEVNSKTMTIDQEALSADIETYGLFTYVEFAKILPVSETIFEAFNGQYLKIAIGKGLIDFETLNALVERYEKFF